MQLAGNVIVPRTTNWCLNGDQWRHSKIDIGNIFGSKPRIAKYKPVNLTAEQGKAIAGNVSNFPDIAHLGDLYSDQELSQLEKILPGYGARLSAGQATTDALFSQAQPLLHGEIPQDVQDAVQRSSAYQSLSGGYAGSPMSKALTARDLGLTSLNLMNQGASLAGQGVNSMQAWDSLARRDMLDPGSMFVTPAQEGANTQTQNLLSQQQRQNQFNVDAAPDPVAKGIFDSTMSVIGMVLSAYGGGGGYKAPASPSYSTGLNFNQGAMYGSPDNPGYFNSGYSADVAQYG